MQQIRLRHPGLDLWVDVRLARLEGRWVATADLGEDRPDVGSGASPGDAIRRAVLSLGEPYARELAASAPIDP